MLKHKSTCQQTHRHLRCTVNFQRYRQIESWLTTTLRTWVMAYSQRDILHLILIAQCSFSKVRQSHVYSLHVCYKALFQSATQEHGSLTLPCSVPPLHLLRCLQYSEIFPGFHHLPGQQVHQLDAITGALVVPSHEYIVCTSQNCALYTSYRFLIVQ